MNYKTKVGIAIIILLYLYVLLPDVGVVYVCCCINFIQGDEIWTPVLLASYENQVDVLELLIQHGAQLDVRNEVSITIVLPTQYCALTIVSRVSTHVPHFKEPL